MYPAISKDPDERTVISWIYSVIERVKLTGFLEGCILTAVLCNL